MHESAWEDTPVQESVFVYERSERRQAEPDGPSRESIARARAAQQREREAFTTATGVAVRASGTMIIRSKRSRSSIAH